MQSYEKCSLLVLSLTLTISRKERGEDEGENCIASVSILIYDMFGVFGWVHFPSDGKEAAGLISKPWGF
jgi:hypothetical protein